MVPPASIAHPGRTDPLIRRVDPKVSGPDGRGDGDVLDRPPGLLDPHEHDAAPLATGENRQVSVRPRGRIDEIEVVPLRPYGPRGLRRAVEPIDPVDEGRGSRSEPSVVAGSILGTRDRRGDCSRRIQGRNAGRRDRRRNAPVRPDIDLAGGDLG